MNLILRSFDLSIVYAINITGHLFFTCIQSRSHLCNARAFALPQLVLGDLQLMYEGDTAVAAETFREAERYCLLAACLLHFLALLLNIYCAAGGRL
jgi:hypothetical protein